MTQAVSDLLEEIKEGNWDPVVYAEVYAKTIAVFGFLKRMALFVQR